MSFRESFTEGKLVDWAEAHGVMHSKLSGKTGFPDRAFWLPGGRPTIIEVKRLGEEPRKLQYHYLNLLNDLGYDVTWVDNEEEGTAYLEKRLAETSDWNRRSRTKGNRVGPRKRR